MVQQQVQIPQLDFRAEIKRNTFNEENNTIEVVASGGGQVRRNPWFSESYIEELEISAGAVRLFRLQNGAPVLKDHNARTVDKQLGVVESSRIEDGQLIVVVRFSSREEFKPLIKDIRDGIVRNVSIGYRTYKREEQDERGEGNLRIFRATDWEPFEVSFVTIPADPNAGSRSDDVQKYDCTIIERDNQMAKNAADQGNENRSQDGCAGQEKTPVETRVQPETPKVDLEELRKQAIEDERNRVTEVRKACSQANLTEKADEYISAGTSIEDVRKALLEELAQRDQKTVTSNVQVGENLSAEGMKRGMENAILHRIDGVKYKLDDQGKHYRHMKLIDLVRDSLSAKGINHRNMPVQEIAVRGLHSTSDFPEILANVSNKTLRAAYQESPQTFAPFTRRVTVSDFKEISRTQIGDAPKLLEKLENGEYQAGSTSEGAEKYSVKEYGRVVPIGRRVIVDDDLSAFTRMPAAFGRQASNLESDKVIEVITTNPLMADGNALFSAAHGNLAGAGAAISITTLAAGRAAMRLQKSLDDSHLNLRPALLYTPVALETIADQFTSQIVPNTAGDVNPYGQAGRTPLTVGTEPRLDDASATAWYLFSTLADIDMIELATLEGEEGPVIDSMIDFMTDGIKLKARHTIGVKAIDWRGMYKNPGA